MKKMFFLALCLSVFGAWSAGAVYLDPNLDDELIAANPEDQINVYVILSKQVDLKAIDAIATKGNWNMAKRHELVISSLQKMAAETQGELLTALNSAKASAQVTKIKPFWITNSIAITANPEFIYTLLERKDLMSVYLDPAIELIEPVGEPVPSSASEGKGVEGGITSSRAPELWAMGIDGTGTLACDQDTGAQGSHAAFSSRWRGLDGGVTPAEAWFDPVYGQTFPTDSGIHGTHTLGTIVGDDGGANQIGMAPGAKWIGAKTIDTPGGDIFTDAVAAFQWSADPDGNPATTDDVPDVVNNSWGLHQGYWGECRTDFNASIDSAEAAGVVVVFAAGNEGSGAETLRSPANRIATELSVFSVGALNQDNATAAYFSSRGPSDCDGSTIKPEVAAVGVDVRSSVPTGSYAQLDGTSMATPHVAGAVLLLRQNFPDTTPDQVKNALYQTAVDLGTAGEDNTYGRGRIDVVAAYNYLKAMCDVDNDTYPGAVCGGPDCNDGDTAFYPGAPEGCNGLDNDCDGSPAADEADADTDGVMICEGDCDDTRDDVYPGAPELCDGVDNNCNDQTDEGCGDDDDDDDDNDDSGDDDDDTGGDDDDDNGDDDDDSNCGSF